MSIKTTDKQGWILFFLTSLGLLLPQFAVGHSGDKHQNSGIKLETVESVQEQIVPITVGGDFTLLDHNLNIVSPATYKGKHLMVFFGYVNCKNMCSLTLDRIGKALELLGEDVSRLTPLVITVDPERDTPETLGPALEKIHPSLIGLSGTEAQLQQAYKAYKQKPIPVENDWQGDPVISHSSYIYLMDPQGKFKTLFPPILNPESMAKIMRKYISQGA